MCRAGVVALRFSNWSGLTIHWDRLTIGRARQHWRTTSQASRSEEGCAEKAMFVGITQTHRGHLQIRALSPNSRFRLRLLAPIACFNILISNVFSHKGCGCVPAVPLLYLARSKPRIMGSSNRLSNHSRCSLHRSGMAISNSYDGVLGIFTERLRG